MKKKKLIRKFDKHAETYEKNRNNKTLARWRRQIIPYATGDVLEVGVGVGANFPYYRKDVTITAVDFSAEMIKRAKESARKFQVKTHFIEADMDELSFEKNAFDTIVSTLTVCGYRDPMATLNRLHKWCKIDGAVLFMEHGLSSNPLLSLTQKAINPLFKTVSGCNCNRNIPELIEAANFEIVRIERYWSNVFSLIWARPRKYSRFIY